MFEFDLESTHSKLYLKKQDIPNSAAIKDNPVSEIACPLHFWLSQTLTIQIKLFLYSNNRSVQTTKFVLHCLVSALGSSNDKNSKRLKISNELHVEKHMRLSKHIQP